MNDIERLPYACRLALAVAQHIDERGQLWSPVAARDKCHSESMAFMETLAGYGVKATVVDGFEYDDHGYIANGHTAVRIGDYVWDWTLRQFDPKCDVPEITAWHDWRARWRLKPNVSASSRGSCAPTGGRR